MERIKPGDLVAYVTKQYWTHSNVVTSLKALFGIMELEWYSLQLTSAIVIVFVQQKEENTITYAANHEYDNNSFDKSDVFSKISYRQQVPLHFEMKLQA